MPGSEICAEINNILYKHGILNKYQILSDMQVDLAEGEDFGKLGYFDKKQNKRYKMRVGKFIKKFLEPNISDTDLQKVGADIIASLWITGDFKVKELSGEALREFYLMTESGIESCMAWNNTQEFLDIYVDNPEVVKLATVRLGSYAARALIWDIPGKGRYLDRIFSTSHTCHVALKNYATQEGIRLRDHMCNLQVELKIKNGRDSFWPYMDTMRYMDIVNNHTCLLSTEEGMYYLQTTDGDLGETQDCSLCGEGVSSEHEYGNSRGEIFCEDCFNTTYTPCSVCRGEEVREDVILVEGKDVCEACFDTHVGNCVDCGEDFFNSNLTETTDGYVCDDCLEKYYVKCYSCGNPTMSEGITIINDESYCVDCSDKFFTTCDSCEKVFSVDNIKDGLCQDCGVEQMERINSF